MTVVTDVTHENVSKSPRIIATVNCSVSFTISCRRAEQQRQHTSVQSKNFLQVNFYRETSSEIEITL